jgi:hypothetical protein
MSDSRHGAKSDDLKDYAVPFSQDITLSDFDKDLLIEMWHTASLCFGSRTARWYSLVKEEADVETAKEIVRDVWIRGNALDLEERFVAAGVNIPDRDVIGVLKAMQWDVGQQGIIDTTLELVDDNPYHGRATVHKCTAHDACNLSGDFELLEILCDEVCLYGYEQVGRWYNPHIQSVTTKLPPFEKRATLDEMPCQCEFFIPGKSGETIEVTTLEDYSGPELEDYSGPFLSGFNTDETAKKFSKKTLIGIIEAAGKHESAMAGLYCKAAEARLGQEVAFELDQKQSINSLVAELSMVRKVFNIEGTDIEALFKCYQVMPLLLVTTPGIEFDLQSEEQGTLTVRECRPLKYCKKHGRTSLQDHLCGEICVDGLQASAGVINPDIKVTPLKRPKRQRNAWEIWKEEGVTDAEEAKALVRELMMETDWPTLGPVSCQWEFKIE